MAGIDLSKPTTSYDAAASQTRINQSQVQQQQQQQAVQSGVLTNGGANATGNGAAAQSAAQANQASTYQQPSPNSNNYNNSLLSDVLPSDGGTGEATTAGADAAASDLLSNVDFSNPFFALKPLSDTTGNIADTTTQSGADDAPANATADGTANTSANVTTGDGGISSLAQLVVQSLVDEAERAAEENGTSVTDVWGSDASAGADGATSTDSQNSPQTQLQQQQGSTSAQQKAHQTEAGVKGQDSTQSTGTGKPGEEQGPGRAEGTDESRLDPENVGDINVFLKQQMLLQNPKEKALAALLRGEQVTDEALESTQAALEQGEEASLLGGFVGDEGGALEGARTGEMRGAMAMRGEAGGLAQAAESALEGGVQNNARMLTMMMANMPAGGTSQPVLAMIAADIFRLQSLRLELMASMRGVDEDGEMPPVDEDEAALKQRAIQGVDLNGMWRWDARPKSDAELEEEEKKSAEIWFRTALLTCALQRPNLVAPMFRSTEEAHSVRLFEREDDVETFSEKWVQIPAKQTGLEQFSVQSDRFAAWVNLAEQAFAHARLGPNPVVCDDPVKNAKAQATALQAILGKPTYSLVRDMDEDEAARRTFFKALCRSNAPHSMPTVITTREATFKDDGLRPSFAYGVLGAFVREDAWSVILCEDRGSDPEAQRLSAAELQSEKAFRIFSVPYQVVHRNAAALVFLPGGA